MFQRYAIYFTGNGAFASAGAAWLGWDQSNGQTVEHPKISGVDVDTLSRNPRKYGFHGTIKAPFRLAEGNVESDLLQATEKLCATLAPVSTDGLELTTLGRFIAFTPKGDQTALRDLAGQVVRDLDQYRAPLSDAELAKRRKANLSADQDALLQRWGYPYVMDEFHFHITLTGRMPYADIARNRQAIATYFAPYIPTPFSIDALTVSGERPDGRFVTVKEFPLAG